MGALQFRLHGGGTPEGKEGVQYSTRDVKLVPSEFSITKMMSIAPKSRENRSDKNKKERERSFLCCD